MTLRVRRLAPDLANVAQGGAMAEPNLADAADAWQRGCRGDAERLARAVAARDPHDVDAHRLRRVRTSAPLFDIRRFCRRLEQAFLEVADRRRRGEPPRLLLVAPRSAGDPVIDGTNS
jgi:hypothetical protein